MGGSKVPPAEMEPVRIGLVNEDNMDYFSRFFAPSLKPRVLSGELTALGAVVGVTACGAIVYGLDERLVTLESIYVAPDFRRQYIASTLFCEMADFFDVFPDLGAQSVSVVYADDGKELFPFFQKLGFAQEESEDGEQTAVVPVLNLASNEMLRRTDARGYTVVPFSELSPPHIRQLDTVLDNRGANYSGMSVESEEILTDISFVGYKNREPEGCVCFSRGGQDEFVLSVFFTNNAAPSLSVSMLSAAYEALSRSYPDASIVIPLVTKSAVRLAEHLLGECFHPVNRLYRGVFSLVGQPE